MTKIDQRLWLILTCIVFVFIVLPESVGRWSTLLDELVSSNDEVADEGEISALRTQSEQLRSKVADLRSSVKTLIGTQSLDSQNAFDLVLGTVKSAKLRMVTFTPNLPAKSSKGQPSLHLEVEGRFETLRTFLYDLERAPVKIEITRVDMVKQNESKLLLLKLDAVPEKVK